MRLVFFVFVGLSITILSACSNSSAPQQPQPTPENSSQDKQQPTKRPAPPK